MNEPRVSICLPSLNTFPYLAERIETIRAQTFTNWELIAVDSYSEDGSYEFLADFCSRDKRSRMTQAPRDGIYRNFNRCIGMAKGEYVYIATSDDTMAVDCLEKMVKALDENPDCDLAHCPMRVIDQDGATALDWWCSSSIFARSSGDLLKHKHKRVAPLDGVLCLLGDNIYSSVTQLLIRRSLFGKIGDYRPDWGSLGDFHWNLRAGLTASAVHVPGTWGGWRMHASQATAGVGLNSPEHQAKIDSMIEDVLGNLDRCASLATLGDIFWKLEGRAREVKTHIREHGKIANATKRRMFVARQALMGNRPAREHLASLVVGGKRWPGKAAESVCAWFDADVLISLEKDAI